MMYICMLLVACKVSQATANRVTRQNACAQYVQMYVS